jgi:hypothetical protein
VNQARDENMVAAFSEDTAEKSTIEKTPISIKL